MNSRKIFIIDNDTTVLEFLSRWLTDAGYDVLKATDGEQASAILSAEPAPQELLLVVDVALSTESGIDLAERLAQKWSPLRFLFISGFADAVVFSANKFPSCKTAFLAKPFTRKQFVKAVETLSAS